MYVADFKMVFKFSRDISEITDLRVLYRRIVIFAQEFLNLDFSTLMLLTDGKNRLTVIDTLGFPPSVIDTYSLMEGHGLSTYVVKEKTAAVVYDFSLERRFAVPSLIAEHGITSAICVPMMIGDEPFGVLIGHTRKCRDFSTDEIQVFQNVGNLAAMAILNARTMQELQHANEEWETTFNAIPDLLAILDNDQRILRANKAMIERLGKPGKAVLGCHCYELVHGMDHPPSYCPVVSPLEDEDYRIASLAGGILCGKFAITVVPLHDTSGQQRGYFHIARDMSASERIQAELKEKENFLRTIIETEPECIGLLAVDGTLLHINRAGLEMFEADFYDRIEGTCIYDLISPEYHQAFRDLNEQVFKGNPGNLEFELIGLQERRLWLETHSVPLRNADQAITANLAIMRDITEQKEAQERLNEYRIRLEELVKGRTRKLRETTRKLEEELRERKFLEKTLNEIETRERRRISQNLHDDMGQLLVGMAFKVGAFERSLAKTTSPLAAEAGQLAALVERAKERLRRLLSGFDLSEECSFRLPSALKQLAEETQAVFGVSCYFSYICTLQDCENHTAAQIYRIAQEAVTNAVKHGAPQSITISILRRRGRVVIEIRDDGKGLPPEPSRSNGMGLRIMKYRAGMIDATLSIRNIPRHGGTVVTCTLPDTDQAKKMTANKILEKKGNRGNRPH